MKQFLYVLDPNSQIYKQFNRQKADDLNTLYAHKLTTIVDQSPTKNDFVLISPDAIDQLTTELLEKLNGATLILLDGATDGKFPVAGSHGKVDWNKLYRIVLNQPGQIGFFLDSLAKKNKPKQAPKPEKPKTQPATTSKKEVKPTKANNTTQASTKKNKPDTPTKSPETKPEPEVKAASVKVEKPKTDQGKINSTKKTVKPADADIESIDIDIPDDTKSTKNKVEKDAKTVEGEIEQEINLDLADDSEKSTDIDTGSNDEQPKGKSDSLDKDIDIEIDEPQESHKPGSNLTQRKGEENLEKVKENNLKNKPKPETVDIEIDEPDAEEVLKKQTQAKPVVENDEKPIDEYLTIDFGDSDNQKNEENKKVTPPIKKGGDMTDLLKQMAAKNAKNTNTDDSDDDDETVDTSNTSSFADLLDKLKKDDEGE